MMKQWQEYVHQYDLPESIIPADPMSYIELVLSGHGHLSEQKRLHGENEVSLWIESTYLECIPLMIRCSEFKAFAEKLLIFVYLPSS